MASFLKRRVGRVFSRPRNLKRDLKRQADEAYWRRRSESSHRRLLAVSRRYRFSVVVASLRRGLPIMSGTANSCLIALLIGGSLAGLILALEKVLIPFIPGLVPAGETLGSFSTVVLPVQAGFLGFYLATVGIVLGHSYENVSESVRQLILQDARTLRRLRWLCRALGYGLVLVLLGSAGQALGYLTVGVYALLAALGVVCFFRLAFGAFKLFDPAVLGIGPVMELSNAIGQLGSKGLHGHDAVLRHTARKTDRSLRTLSEIVTLTGERQSHDRTGLRRMTIVLLEIVKVYSDKKHLLKPDSGWFLSKPVYPRWVETNPDEMALALKTSTPLLTRTEPKPDWLEQRVAELGSSALKACVEANDTDSALHITSEMANAARMLARRYWIDDAVRFAGIFHDGCLALRPLSESDTANEAFYAVADNPRIVLTTLLLGWKEAVTSWPSEIQGIVDSNEWDRNRKATVRMRGPARMLKATQRLLRQVRAERDIEGHRVTPKWFLRSELATECILSLQEFSDDLPRLLDQYFVKENEQQHPSHVRASIGLQALQTIAKADLLAEAIPKVIEELEGLQQGHAPSETPEVIQLPERLRSCRARVLKRMAESAPDLRPEKSTSRPDYSGQVLATLVHHTEQAIADGDTAVVVDLFPAALSCTMDQQNHMVTTYKPPQYQFTSWVLHPTIDLLELSGLALIYEALRNDASAEPVRVEWHSWIQGIEDPTIRASLLLRMLDDEATDLVLASRREFEWNRRLTERVIKAGYAMPRYSPFTETPAWNAPRLFKILRISEDRPMSRLVTPRAIFAGEVIAPLSGEPEEQLRERPGLKHYYTTSDRASQ